jgi:hypothetical protein
MKRVPMHTNALYLRIKFCSGILREKQICISLLPETQVLFLYLIPFAHVSLNLRCAALPLLILFQFLNFFALSVGDILSNALVIEIRAQFT